jgi:hypothetical protein
LRAVLAEHVVIDVIEARNRYVLLARVHGRALIAVVADDELDDATVVVSVYEADAEHGWTSERVDRTLRSDEPREGPR